MVSKARLDLPEPDSPVITMSWLRGISTEIFFRLCTRAPCTAMVVRASVRAVTAAVLEFIRWIPREDERQLLDYDVTFFGDLQRRRNLDEEAEVGQVLAGHSHSFQIEVALKPGLDLSRRTRFPHLPEIIEYRAEERGRAPGQVSIDGIQGSLYVPLRFPRIEQARIDGPEEFGIQLHRLRDDFAVGEQSRAEQDRKSVV